LFSHYLLLDGIFGNKEQVKEYQSMKPLLVERDGLRLPLKAFTRPQLKTWEAEKGENSSYSNHALTKIFRWFGRKVCIC